MCRSNEDSQDGSFQKSKCLHETSLLATLPELCIQTLDKLLNTLAERQGSCRNRELAKSAQIMTDSPSLTCRRKRDNQVSPRPHCGFKPESMEDSTSPSNQAVPKLWREGRNL
ncbi:unnamed protein product [Prunus armeniaca]